MLKEIKRFLYLQVFKIKYRIEMYKNKGKTIMLKSHGYDHPKEKHVKFYYSNGRYYTPKEYKRLQ